MRLAERVDDTAEQRGPTGPRARGRCVLTLVALLDLEVVAQDDRADVVLFEVEGHAERSVRELDHLVGHHVLEAVDARDPVTDLQDGADPISRL
jgi:hypothetical protein